MLFGSFIGLCGWDQKPKIKFNRILKVPSGVAYQTKGHGN